MHELSNSYHSGQRLPGIFFALAMLGLCVAQTARCQTPYQTQAGKMVLYQSAGATRVTDKIRSSTQGVMSAVFVKPGDIVNKGQLLGHLELDATKLQLDLARHTLDAKSTVEAALGQADAWTATREETEEDVRRRKAQKSRLDWAIAMEKMYRANHQNQLDLERAQEIQFEYCQDQYEKRFFRAPFAGVVTETSVEVGKPVNFATHVFTVSNDDSYSLSVSVPAGVAEAATLEAMLPVRSADGKSVTYAKVDCVMDDPITAGNKIIKLFVQAADFPATLRQKLKGMKFDILLPQVYPDSATETGTSR